MSFWPKSRSARRRLTIVLAIAPVLVLAAALALYGLRDKASLFMTPSQVASQHPAPGRRLDIGGLVQTGSIVKYPDGRLSFVVTDNSAYTTRVNFKGDPPDMFEEGKGVVASGAFGPDGAFVATNIMAKHDEQYMPVQVKKALQKEGQWRPEMGGAAPKAKP